MSDRILIKKARLSFLHCFVPKPFAPGDPPKYQVQTLLDPSTAIGKANIKKVQQGIVEVAKQKWGEKYNTFEKVQKFLGRSKLCLRDHKYDEKEYDSHKGMWYVAANNDENRAPVCLDQYKKEVEQKDGVLYSGCYGHVTISLWAQDNKWGKRINANFRAVMFAEDGEPFSGGAPVDDSEFDEIEAEEVDVDSLLEDGEDWEDEDLLD